MQLPARILLPLLLLFTVHFSRAQGITLSVENQALEKVMGSIEQQSGHRFVYSAEMMALSKPVTVSFRNETLNRALEIVFRDQPLTYTFNEKHIVLQVKKSKAAEDRRVLTGQVVDEKGEGLPGISVLIKGTRQGTMTDPLGQFRLEDVPASFRLLVSGVSIESREIAVSNTDFLKIETTPKLGELDQTVVIAYGTAKKRYLVESVSKVKGEDLSKQSVSNPILALGGRVAGLQIIQGSGVPGSNVTIRLRGRNSMVNGNDPLVVVDGVPFPTSVLNDNFYAGGVTSSPLDNLNIASIESIEILKDASATAIYGSRGANGVILITTKKGTSRKPEINVNTYVGTGKITRPLDLLNTPQFLNMRREAFRNDNSNPTNSNAPDLKLWDTTRYTDWQKKLIGNRSTVSDLNLSVGWGNSSTKILTGTGYRRETTVFPGDFYTEKVSALLNVNHRMSKNVDFSVSVNFSQKNTRLPSEDLTTYIKTAPNAPEVFTADGKLNWSNASWNNPWSAVMQTFHGKVETWQSSANFSYHLFDGLQFRVNGGFTSISLTDNYRTPAESLSPNPTPVAKAGFARRDIRTYIWEPQLSYSKDHKNDSKIDILIGGSFQISNQNGVLLTGTGYASDDLLGSIASASSISVSSENNIRYKYAAFFGRVQYDIKRRYLISVNMRRDGSSRYGPENRFANFASAGIGWIFSSEKWFPKQDWLEFSKVRVTSGFTGNDQIGDYKYLDLYAPYSRTYQSIITYAPSQLFSPDFTWEKVRKTEIGLDLSAIKGRVSVTLNYFLNKTTNQLVNYSLPATTGFAGVLRNIPATIRNYGLELEIGADIIRRKDVKWHTSFNLTVPKNRLVSFKDFESSTYASTYVIGQPLSVARVFEFLGVDPSSGLYTFRDFNGDGKISNPADLQKIIATPVKFFGGFENTVEWKQVSFSVHIGFNKTPFARGYFQLFQKPGSIDNQPVEVLERWQKNGDYTNIQRFTATASSPSSAYNNFRQSDAQLSDASFVRLRSALVAWKFRQYKVYLSGQNLVTWTKYKGMDPETLTLLPPVKMVAAGINLNF